MRYGPRCDRSSRISMTTIPFARRRTVQEQLHELVRRHRLAGQHRVRRRQRERAQQPSRDDRLDRDASRCASNRRTSASLSAIGRRVHLVEARADARHQPPDVDDALLEDHDRGDEPVFELELLGDRRPTRLRAAPGRARPRPRRAMTSSLSAKTRKIVPSAMPAASAICRLVTRSPCSSSSGSVAATIIDRRSSGGNAAARLDFTGVWFKGVWLTGAGSTGVWAAVTRGRLPE